jgi:hypothetical protein
MSADELAFLLQAAFCRVRVLASQPIDDERRRLIWEIVDAAHNLPLIVTGSQDFPSDVIREEAQRLERLLVV